MVWRYPRPEVLTPLTTASAEPFCHCLGMSYVVSPDQATAVSSSEASISARVVVVLSASATPDQFASAVLRGFIEFDFVRL